MKSLRKALALMLCVLTLVSLFSVAASADTRLRVVNIGNESTAGFGLPGYGAATANGEWSDSFSGNGASFGFLNNFSAESYVSTFAKYLNTLEGGSGVEVTNLSMEGMRTDELRAILQPDFAKLAANKSGNGDTYLASHMIAYNKWFANAKNKAGVGGMGITEYFTNAISNANVITVDLSMSNVESYLLQRLQAIFGVGGYNKNDYAERASDLQNELDFDVPFYEDSVTRVIKNLLPEDSGLPVDDIMAALTYCYCDFVVNFTKDMEFLLKLNDHAKIIVVGASNMFSGMKLDLGENSVDLGTLCSTYVTLVNHYLTNGCKYAKQYYYADVSFGQRTYVQNMSLAASPDSVDAEYADALIAEVLNSEYVLFPNIGEKYVATKNEYRQLLIREGELVRANDLGDEYDRVSARIKKIENSGYPALAAEADVLLDSFMRAADMQRFDLNGVLDIMSDGYLKIMQTVITTLKNWSEASTADKSVTYVYMRFLAADGMGNLPDPYGHNQKYEAVKSAYIKVLPASTDDDGTFFGSLSGAFGSILNVFRTPVLQKIADIFSGFNFSSFGEFFRALGNGVVSLVNNIFGR